jgi:AcrR family transcriptional regulator
MSHISAEDRARAAETKRRRTRDRLIHAADRVFEDNGLNATIEAIAEEARISVATFYNYYTSRNALCMHAFTELVVAVLEPMVFPVMPLHERIAALSGLVEGREMLTRAALIGRLEEGNWDTPESREQRIMYQADFVDRLSYLLWAYDAAAPIAELKAGIPQDAYLPLHAAALEILDLIVRGRPVDTRSFAWIGGL